MVSNWQLKIQIKYLSIDFKNHTVLSLNAYKIVHCAVTNGKQSFDQEPDSKIEVNPGQDVILPCRIYQKSRNSICNWQKDGYPISLQTGKYQWDGDKQRGDCSLKIFKADINFDNGKINLFSFNTSNLKNYFRLHICMSFHLL